MNLAIIASSDHGIRTAKKIEKFIPEAVIVSTRTDDSDKVLTILSIAEFLDKQFNNYSAFLFIGALGICVRSIAPYIKDKSTDPAVINADDHGLFVQSVLSGHAGKANDLARQIAHHLGAQPVITTSSDVQELWSLDLLPSDYGWKTKWTISQNKFISLFINNVPTALFLEVKDAGTQFLEKTCPSHVKIYYEWNQIPLDQFQLVISVGFTFHRASIPLLQCIPQVLSAGIGCSRGVSSDLLKQKLFDTFYENRWHTEALKNVGSIDIKYNEEALISLTEDLGIPFITFSKEALSGIPVKNPSDVVMQKLGVPSVSEASSLLLAGHDKLLLEKQKFHLEDGKMFTLAISLDRKVAREAEIFIVGAGPGDSDLISVKGKELLEKGDLVLYAGSLIPEKLTRSARKGALVLDSSGMTLEEQMTLMRDSYQKGWRIIRLQSGDPSIYGAIQEQISLFEQYNMRYTIVPGISSFQAAAAVLRSEFTIPEVVQTIILTRGEGNTPLPEKEKLNEMAKHHATMCIFLSATISKSVQSQLLEHYPPETPLAVLYRVTWEDEKVITGRLDQLASIIRENKFTRTVLIIVGKAIGARENRSQLYHPDYKHIFRTGKEKKKQKNSLQK